MVDDLLHGARRPAEARKRAPHLAQTEFGWIARNTSEDTRRVNPGTVIADRFEIERLAGAGGMSSVYRARDRHGATMVALKLLRENRAGYAERFLREASLLSELRH